jgi:hypothetical protein
MLLLVLWLASADAIVRRNIFCSGCSATHTAEAPPLELLSTLVCPRDPSWSRALLRDQAGEMRLLGSGQRFGPVRVQLITARYVVVGDGDATWRLLLQQPAPAPPVPVNRCQGERCTLQRADVERMVAHPELLAARALATPDGFVLRMGPSSPLRQVGLRDGDRLRAIDGTPLTADAILHLWPKLRRASRFTLSLVRDGRPLAFEVAVE